MNIFVGAPGREFLGSSEVFIILFVTFGPINFINRYYQTAASLDTKALAGFAIRIALIATAAIALSGYVGSKMLGTWQISIPAIALTGAIVLFVVAMKSVVTPYQESASDPAPVSSSRAITPLQLAFPYVATPYGIAAFIVLLTLAPESATQLYVMLLVVMLIDLVMMLFVKPIMRVLGVPLGLLATVLSVLQVALSFQFAFFAIRTLIAKGI